MGTRGVRHFCLFGEGVKQSCALVGEGERNQVLVSQTTRNIDRLITPRMAVLGICANFSATAPLAIPKKGGARRGGANVKKMTRWQ